MPEKVFNFKVEMSCAGCSNALTKVLDKHRDKGVGGFEIDLPGQSVKVTSSSLSSDEVMEIVKKAGKKVDFVSEQVN